MVLVVRSSRPTRSVLEGVRGVVDGLDSTLPFYESGPLSDRVLFATGTEHLLSRLMALLAAAAGVLAGIGLYGLVASSGAERNDERHDPHRVEQSTVPEEGGFRSERRTFSTFALEDLANQLFDERRRRATTNRT